MTLNLDSFNDGSKKKSKTKYKAALGVSSVVGLFGIGSTLAANISLNGGGNVEFGQGVATTAACDEDGFSITPVTRYDNNNSIFRVSHLEITGIDLTPEGSLNNTSDSYAELGITDKNSDSAINQVDAKLQYPGLYYNGSDWKRTCDNVVLDFRAYTDDPAFAKYTTAGYFDVNTTDTTAPLMWSQRFDGNGNLSGTGSNSLNVPGLATAIDVGDESGSESNYAWDVGNNYDLWWGSNDNFDITSTTLEGTNSSFTIRLGQDSWTYFYNDGNDYYDGYQPNAAAISKITVQSMKYFPENYYADNIPGPGTNENTIDW